MMTLILGASGQLGTELARLLPEAHCYSRQQLDLTDETQLQQWIQRQQPACVINCAAYTQVDRAETEAALAFQINALSPRVLARCCREAGTQLIHVSTDFVFGSDPNSGRPWQETDLPGPVSAYGNSKLAGEYFIQAECPEALIVRSCGLYGSGGTGNFVKTMLRVAAQRKPLRVVDDQICAPTSIADLAEAILALKEQRAAGLYHFVNQGAVSWFQFAQKIFETVGWDVDLMPIRSAEFNAPARRPVYSVLACDKYKTVTGRGIRSIDEALTAYLQDFPLPERVS